VPNTAAERLNARLVLQPNGCLEWTGRSVNPKGYAKIRDDDDKMTLAHRLAWKLVNGPIPPDLKVLHHCDNPPCCQTEPTEDYPEGHLFLGTAADNMADMKAKGRSRGWDITHCPQNHPYTASNTYVSPRGHRFCRTCNRAAVARYKAKRAALSA
jgi:hypothetical protein